MAILANSTSRSTYVSPVPRWLPAVAGGVVVGLGWWLFARAQWQQWRAQTPALAAVQAAQVTIGQELTQLKSLQAEYQTLAAVDMTRLDLALPRHQDIPSLLAQVEGMAQAVGFALTSLQISAEGEPNDASRLVRDDSGDVIGVDLSAPGQTPHVGQLYVNLTLGPGTYEQLKQLLEAVDESLRLASVTSVNFSAGENSAGYIVNLRLPYFSA